MPLRMPLRSTVLHRELAVLIFLLLAQNPLLYLSTLEFTPNSKLQRIRLQNLHSSPLVRIVLTSLLCVIAQPPLSIHFTWHFVTHDSAVLAIRHLQVYWFEMLVTVRGFPLCIIGRNRYGNFRNNSECCVTVSIVVIGKPIFDNKKCKVVVRIIIKANSSV